MRIQFTNQLLTIPAGQAFSGVAGQPQSLQITAGEVWVTVEGSSHDHWLTAGDSLTLAPGRLVVIEADKTDSRIALQANAGNHSPQAISGRLQHWVTAMARRLHLPVPQAARKTCHCS